MKINLDKIKAKIAELNGENKGKSSSDVQLWKPGLGEYVIRCLHWPEGVCRDGEVFFERWFYYNIGKSAILTPEQFGKPDPIQELRQTLFKSGTQTDKEIAKKLFPKMRSYVPVVVLSGPDADPDKVLVWAFGSQIYQQLLNYFMNSKVGDYFDPHSGFNINIKISKQKNKQFNDVDVELDAFTGRCSVADTEEKIQALIKAIPAVSNMYTLKSYETIKKDLDAWLNGGTPVNSSTDTNGTEKTSSKADVLNDLAELATEVKNEKKEKAPKSERKAPVAKVSSEPKKAAVVEESDFDESNASDDLDSAFADLMDE